MASAGTLGGEDPCLEAYQNIASRLRPPQDQKISENLQAHLLEVWERSQTKIQKTLSALEGHRVPTLDSEWILLLNELQEARLGRAKKVGFLRAQRRALREQIEIAGASSLDELKIEKKFLDDSVNTLMAEIEAITEILLPVREWVGLSVIQNSAAELAKKSGAVVILRNTPASAAGQLIKFRLGKSIEFKFHSSDLGVIAGLVPRNQSWSKAAAQGTSEVARLQAEVDSAIQRGQVNSHPFQIGTFVAVHRKGEIKFVDKSKETIDPAEIVEVLSLPIEGESNRLLVSDVDPFAFGFKQKVPPAEMDKDWGLRNSLEQEWMNQFNALVDQKMGSKEGKYITHGPENRNPASNGVSGYPLAAFLPDGTMRVIPKGPAGDPDQFLKAFYQEARQQGFKLEENPLWGWP